MDRDWRKPTILIIWLILVFWLLVWVFTHYVSSDGLPDLPVSK